MTDGLQLARAVLSRFTPTAPMFVPPSVFRAMKRDAGLADMMDRVAETQPLPRA